MNIKLYNPPCPNFGTLVQILFNRGIPIEIISGYIKTNITNVSPAEKLGEKSLEQGLKMLASCISADEDLWLCVDADLDGYFSAALFINYLYDLFPAFVINHVKWTHHDGKAHGLGDVMDEARKYKYIVMIDSSSNDYDYHEELFNQGTHILVIDHHEADHISPWVEACINPQLCDYPNKALCGGAVAWLFCKYIDRKLNKDYADTYLDLVAVSLQSDMMSGLSAETKALIFEGLKSKNIHNPFVAGMIEKNNFSFNKADYKPSFANGMEVSPMGISFFLTPMVNAITRTGTIEEKTLIFNSLLKFKAFDYVPSTKRGHKLGETEQVVTQALRVATNVKRHQDEAVTKGMEYLECMIKQKNLLDHKVLLFLLKPGEINPNIAGLCANKLMAKYQRCCLVLTEGTEEVDFGPCGDKEAVKVYRGSGRAYSASGLDNFREICAESRGCFWAQGHSSAFGVCLNAEQISEFQQDTDKALANLPNEASYHVDYLWNDNSIEGDKILDIAELNDYIMTDMPRSYVCVKGVKVTPENTMWMKDKHLKIKTTSNIDLIIWDCKKQENELINSTIDVVAKCNANQFNGTTSPQLIAEAWEVVGEVEQSVIGGWGF